MSADTPISPRRLRAARVAPLSVALLLVPVATATGADSDGLQTLTVDGTVMHVVVDRLHAEGDGADEHAPHTEGEGLDVHAGELEVETYLQVDGALHKVPEHVELPDALTGEAVTVTVAAERGASPEEALEAATDQRQDIAAQVVDVGTSTGASGAEVGGEPMLEAAVEGSRSLLVLPVYWSSPDTATRTSLQTLADGTARYWSQQSGGRLAITAQAREWARIVDPGTCDTAAIWSRALAAHRVAAAPQQHIAVYFPRRSDCGGWAGLASIGGGSIWINGMPLADVLTHEFGHNLGLGHANTARCTSSGTRVSLALPFATACQTQEYQDRADVMGIGTTKAPGNLNTAFADHLGFARVQRPGSGSTTVDLAPLGSVSALRSVAIPVSDGTVYVDYRPATGVDTRVPGWAGVQVHLRTTNTRYGYPTTYLLDMSPTTSTPFTAPALAAGRSWKVPGTEQVVSVLSTGATARVSVGSASAVAPPPATTAPPTSSTSPTAATEVERYVSNVYRDLFNRTVDQTGLQTWTSRLASGTPRVQVANAITGSDEYRSRLIAGSYRTYLGRSPDPAGARHWLGQMAGGMTIQQMEAGFLASPEYYQKAGSTSAGWITRLYQHVLGRTPAASEVAHWQRQLGAGSSRMSVALGFLLSTEHLTTVVDGHYVHLLGRHIDPTGRASWVTAIQRGTRVETVIGGIVASDEYYGKR